MREPDRLVEAFRARAKLLLLDFAEDVSTSCDPDPPGDRVFIAEARARDGSGEIRMTFGDREFELCTSVKPAGRPWPLDLRFYLSAMELDDSGVADSMWIHDEERMARVMARHEEALRSCLAKLEEDPRGWWSLAEEERQMAIAEGRSRMRQAEARVATERAAEAFRAGDLERVVSLLTPYEDILSDAQTKKLDYARARVSAPRGDG